MPFVDLCLGRVRVVSEGVGSIEDLDRVRVRMRVRVRVGDRVRVRA